MKTTSFIIFMITLMAMGFSLTSALSLKNEWAWGMSFEPSVHINGLLFGLIVALVGFMFCVFSIIKNIDKSKSVDSQ